MAVPSSTPLPTPGAVLPLPGAPADLRARVLVVGVVPAPRFGREGEVVATARAVVERGADLVDVSLAARLLGPAARAVARPVVVRARDLEAAAAAGRAGAAVALLPAAVVDDAGHEHLDRTRVAVAVVVDDLAALAGAVSVARGAGVPVAFDSTRLAATEALAAEAVAVTDGCRLLRTSDVRRSRRVAEVLGAVLAARLPLDERPDRVERGRRG